MGGYDNTRHRLSSLPLVKATLDLRGYDNDFWHENVPLDVKATLDVDGYDNSKYAMALYELVNYREAKNLAAS